MQHMQARDANLTFCEGHVGATQRGSLCVTSDACASSSRLLFQAPSVLRSFGIAPLVMKVSQLRMSPTFMSALRDSGYTTILAGKAGSRLPFRQGSAK